MNQPATPSAPSLWDRYQAALARQRKAFAAFAELEALELPRARDVEYAHAEQAAAYEALAKVSNEVRDALNAQSTQAPDLSSLVRHYDGGKPRLSFDYMEPDDVRAYVATQAAQIEGLRGALADLRNSCGVPVPDEGGSFAAALERADALFSNLPAPVAAPVSSDLRAAYRRERGMKV